MRSINKYIYEQLSKLKDQRRDITIKRLAYLKYADETKGNKEFKDLYDLLFNFLFDEYGNVRDNRNLYNYIEKLIQDNNGTIPGLPNNGTIETIDKKINALDEIEPATLKKYIKEVEKEAVTKEKSNDGSFENEMKDSELKEKINGIIDTEGLTNILGLESSQKMSSLDKDKLKDKEENKEKILPDDEEDVGEEDTEGTESTEDTEGTESTEDTEGTESTEDTEGDSTDKEIENFIKTGKMKKPEEDLSDAFLENHIVKDISKFINEELKKEDKEEISDEELEELIKKLKKQLGEEKFNELMSNLNEMDDDDFEKFDYEDGEDDEDDITESFLYENYVKFNIGNSKRLLRRVAAAGWTTELKANPIGATAAIVKKHRTRNNMAYLQYKADNAKNDEEKQKYLDQREAVKLSSFDSNGSFILDGVQRKARLNALKKDGKINKDIDLSRKSLKQLNKEGKEFVNSEEGKKYKNEHKKELRKELRKAQMSQFIGKTDAQDAISDFKEKSKRQKEKEEKEQQAAATSSSKKENTSSKENTSGVSEEERKQNVKKTLTSLQYVSDTETDPKKKEMCDRYLNFYKKTLYDEDGNIRSYEDASKYYRKNKRKELKGLTEKTGYRITLGYAADEAIQKEWQSKDPKAWKAAENKTKSFVNTQEKDYVQNVTDADGSVIKPRQKMNGRGVTFVRVKDGHEVGYATRSEYLAAKRKQAEKRKMKKESIEMISLTDFICS